MPKIKLRPLTAATPTESEEVTITGSPELRSGTVMTIQEGLRHELWQETETPHVYRRSVVKTNNPGYYTEKADREGNRIFFSAMELNGLDPGWMSEEEATVYKYRCPIPGCRKKFAAKATDGRPGLLLLQSHLAGFHKREYELGYKERLEKRIREEVIGTEEIEIPEAASA
jgi:hypothetical protein